MKKRTEPWTAAQRRGKAVPVQQPKRVAELLRTDLHNYMLTYASKDCPRYLRDVLAMVEQEVERRAAEELSRWLARLAWDLVLTPASEVEQRVARAIEDAQWHRRLYDERDAWPGDEDLGAQRTLEEREEPSKRVRERIEGALGIRRGQPSARTARQRAVLIYNVFAEGSRAGVQPDSNKARSGVPALIDSVRPSTRKR